ncbi:hypothetical protein [Paraburkholderia sp.]|uniref:hypothetical protein n=1 Tax=Paraburkholderia sp. TaxID=1926495 RepID=UPI003C79C291
MSPYEEYEKAWFATLRTDFLRAELAKKEFKGRYGEARRKRYEAELATKRNYLTPPARYGAALWQRRVLDELRAVQQARADEKKEFLSAWELVAHALELAALPDKETVVRFLNRMGYHTKRGRPKKQ